MPQPQYIDNRRRCRWAVRGLACFIAASAAVIGAFVWLYFGLRNRNVVNLQWVAVGLTTLLQLGALLLAGISFLAWLHRAYGNAMATGLYLRTSFGQGWAIGAWFVPFLNLVLPVQIVLAMWRHAGRERVGGAALVIAWWLLWLLAGAGSMYGKLFPDSSRPADAQSQLLAQAMQTIALQAVLIPTALLAILIVRRLTAAQESMQLLARAEAAFGEETMPGAPPPLPRSTVPGERPVAGSVCGRCGQPIATAHDAFVCTRCDLPLHEDCLREGACPHCRSRDLDAGFPLY